MKIRVVVRSLVVSFFSSMTLLCLLITVFPCLSFAQTESLVTPVYTGRSFVRSSHNLVVPPGLEGRIDFWRKIFTKYGDNHRVFHHRDYPEIIYSVLDFSEYNEKLKGRALLRAREKAVKLETQRIKASLLHLSRANAPRNPFEQRLLKIFRTVLGDSRSHFKVAAAQKNLRYQRGIKERFREGIERSGRYLYAIEKIFAAEGLPLDLGRLPLVESSFNYKAYSSVGAAGIWQFMKATGRRYMRVNYSIDERRDPIIATRAAAKYLKNSYQKLDSWPLAVTSYNHGLAGVMRAVKKVGSKDLNTIIHKYDGKRFGFASGNFYVELVAAVEVERNAERYFPGIVRDAPVYFDEVRLSRAVYIRELSKMISVSKSTIEELNLGLRSPILKNRVRLPKGLLLKVPQGKGKLLLAKMSGSKMLALAEGTAFLSKGRPSEYGGSYRVKRGDTIGGIARRFKLRSSDILAANRIKNPSRIRIGQRLVLPGYGASSTPKSRTRAVRGDSPRSSAKTYVVKSGDTLGGIAGRFGVSQSALSSSNGIKNKAYLKVGQKLRIPSKGDSSRASGNSSAKKSSRSGQYRVKAGDNLGSIARRHGVSIKALMAENGIKDAKFIKIGQRLRIPSTAPAATSNTAALHQVQRGDTLSAIAKENGTTVKRLRSLNPGLNTSIYPGQKLRVR
jgi:membrane-bound lytic murein transglycosylase D